MHTPRRMFSPGLVIGLLAFTLWSCALPAVRAARSLGSQTDRIRAELFNEGASELAVPFASGKATFLPEAMPLLDDATEALRDVDQEKYRLVVVGHTDTTGSAAANLRLSRQRAQAVADYLQEQGGFPWWFLQTMGKGEEDPKITPEATPEDRAVNRRVELRLEETAAD
ncbi:OmpA family protein [Paucidesulfovibrio gracilis DSM 16080]|uniref:OmpA family protein n=1 Tax=Paucidesulfovibrio gracilis DSM 16080 TaxID=1121449 RepID=A0A1T4WRN6_9BACT|nr:OmpA family protein [Paucidesulfovibrio gracilis]SKA80014.1 OmpA family protein [Paucidesulfovibrio gracilis DSM 16080]